MSSSSYLLDTHCLLWFQGENSKIPVDIMLILQDTENTILFSQISLFEIAIKQKIGKTPAFQSTIEDVYNQAVSDGFTFLPIRNQHILRYSDVPLKTTHRDPF